MLGLTDSSVARHGVRLGGSRPGPRRIAAVEYLRKRGVTLVVGQPHVRYAMPGWRTAFTTADLRVMWETTDLPDMAAGQFKLVQMRLDTARIVVLLYLTTHPWVERLLAEGQLEEIPLIENPLCETVPHRSNERGEMSAATDGDQP